MTTIAKALQDKFGITKDNLGSIYYLLTSERSLHIIPGAVTYDQDLLAGMLDGVLFPDGGALVAAKHQGGTYEDLAKPLGLTPKQIHQHLRFGLANTGRARGPLTKGTPK